jgi:hypothetical protein
MKRGVLLRLLIYLVLFLGLLTSSIALSVEELGSNYYYGDQIYLIACGKDADDITADINCLNSKKLYSEKWDEKCKIFAFDSENLE